MTTSLYQKILTTEPGKHADEIGDVLYCHSHKLTEDAVRRLGIVRTYLEALAIAELEQQVESWVKELAFEKAKRE